jgi:hypothetical protein
MTCAQGVLFLLCKERSELTGDWRKLHNEELQDRDQWRALANTVMNLRGSVKCWEVLEWLHNWQLLKKG